MKRIFATSTLILLSLNIAMASVPFTGMYTDDHTLNVPSEFATIQAALSYLDDKTMKAGVTITIQVADGTYTSYDTIQMIHPQGDQIHIIGNTTTPANCTIEFTGLGIYLTNGAKLGLMDGFVLKGALTSSGIYVEKNSFANLGPEMVVREFGQGIHAEYGGHIMAPYVESSYNSLHGAIAQSGSTINVGLGYIAYNGHSGVTASNGGSVYFLSGVSEYNTKNGVHAYSQGTIYANGCTVRNNSQYGFNAQHLALVYATGATNTGNTLGATSELNSGRVITQ